MRLLLILLAGLVTMMFVYSFTTPQPLWNCTLPALGFSTFDFTPDGKRLVLPFSQEREFKPVWLDVHTGAKLVPEAPALVSVTDFALDSSGCIVAVRETGQGCQVHRISPETGKTILMVDSSKAAVRESILSTDGSTCVLFLAAPDGIHVEVYQTLTGKMVSTWALPGRTTEMFSGSYLETHFSIYSHTPWLSPDGSSLITQPAWRGLQMVGKPLVEHWDTRTGKLIKHIPIPQDDSPKDFQESRRKDMYINQHQSSNEVIYYDFIRRCIRWPDWEHPLDLLLHPASFEWRGVNGQDYSYHLETGQTQVEPSGENDCDNTRRWRVNRPSHQMDDQVECRIIDNCKNQLIKTISVPKSFLLDAIEEQQHLRVMTDGPWLYFPVYTRASSRWPAFITRWLDHLPDNWRSKLDPMCEYIRLVNWETEERFEVCSTEKGSLYPRATSTHLAIWDTEKHSITMWAMPPKQRSWWVILGSGCLVMVGTAVMIRRRKKSTSSRMSTITTERDGNSQMPSNRPST